MSSTRIGRFAFPARQVDRFLTDTYRLAPAGTAPPALGDIGPGLLFHLRPE